MDFNDFPPNLQLVDALENRGWKSKIIEPTSVVGEKTTQDSVKNIPPGSVVFLMHDTAPEYILVEKFKEGISYQTYTNEKYNFEFECNNNLCQRSCCCLWAYYSCSDFMRPPSVRSWATALHASRPGAGGLPCHSKLYSM